MPGILKLSVVSVGAHIDQTRRIIRTLFFYSIQRPLSTLHYLLLGKIEAGPWKLMHVRICIFWQFLSVQTASFHLIGNIMDTFMLILEANPRDKDSTDEPEYPNTSMTWHTVHYIHITCTNTFKILMKWVLALLFEHSSNQIVCFW